MSEQKFLETAPEGFDLTMELKFIYPEPDSAFPVLCQKYRGAFRDVWVRVPCD